MSIGASVIIDDFELGVPDTSPRTQEERTGKPDVWRVFPGGPAVYAISVLPGVEEAVQSVEEAASSLLTEYRFRPGYQRVAREQVECTAADAAIDFEFKWNDSHGVTMHSSALVASFAGRTVVVHGTVPDIHGEDAYRAMEAVVLSCRPADREQT